MMLELHHVTIGPHINRLSLTAESGQIVSIWGDEGSGKTTLLRAILGFLPIDEGFISIDGELVTPLSAAYFRRLTAYVPQTLRLPEGYTEVPTDYLQLLDRAVGAAKPLLIVDQPPRLLTADEATTADNMLRDAAQHGAIVVAANPRIQQNLIIL